jgi:4-amino-4-deoxy-L-arabinose transferase-like glycosyltransferase
MRRVIQFICGFAVIAAIFYSWLWTLTFVNRVNIYRDREHYQPAVFIVEEATYSHGDEGGDSWWLTGTVNGREERLVPRFERGARPANAVDLLARNPKGSKVDIYYNSNATEMIVQGETLRAIEMTPDFWQKEKALRNRLGARVLVPVPVTLALYLVVRFMNRRVRAVEKTGSADTLITRI